MKLAARKSEPTSWMLLRPVGEGPTQVREPYPWWSLGPIGLPHRLGALGKSEDPTGVLVEDRVY